MYRRIVEELLRLADDTSGAAEIDAVSTSARISIRSSVIVSTSARISVRTNVCKGVSTSERISVR